jgi:NhaA family Na+:H+ antiporter
LWFFVLKSGVHSTVAGVLMAFAIPARTRCEAGAYSINAARVLDDYREAAGPEESVLTNQDMHSALLAMHYITTRAQTPLQRLVHELHPLVDYVIMPVFALANAGVALSGGIPMEAAPAALGTALGLVLGKPVGIVLMILLIVSMSEGYPRGVTLRHFVGAGLLGGIGFTMSLFIANLAFGRTPEFLAGAKTAVLGASVIAGAAGYLVLRSAPPPERPSD